MRRPRLPDNTIAATTAMVAIGGVLWVAGHLLAPRSVPFLLLAYPLVMVWVVRESIRRRPSRREGRRRRG